MRKKEIIAMLLAGGQGSRLGVLTSNLAKPAVSFCGKYRIIDFALSNCVNSGIDTVGIVTQYQPLRLNQHIGIGIPWDLDRKSGGVTILSPHVRGESGDWFNGTADAIFRNLDYIDNIDPEYVLILSADHIYKMDYSRMLEYHKVNKSTATIAVIEVPIEDASRFGIMNTEDDDKIYDFEEKPEHPKSNLASMGIYIFTWSKLREAIIKDSEIHPDSDFGKHIIPAMLEAGENMYAYRFDEFWRDVGTIESYWQTNMELIKPLPDFNLYDDFWKIYTNFDHQPPQFTAKEAKVKGSLISEGCEVYGEVVNSILGPNVLIEKGAVVKDSIVMSGGIVGENAYIERCILSELCVVGKNVSIGKGENVPNALKPDIYDTGITVTAENTIIPDNVCIGKNCVISGETTYADYKNGSLESGGTISKEADIL
ncbi:MAG: glucose-1-phosphate adenylyltransferase [Firmicutes bacterium]|nr:glucose-1-phosphate adenylyltransferase [Bacillota bacterium]MBQ7241944.1 glucose-1-phosphate adenylyltransferase [Bacillota bacterium]MBR0105402.1 glucose-1-phosphate adenylyltransferase [Bacillota bacterium]